MKCKICKGKLISWVNGLFDDRHGYPGRFKVKKCVDCGFGQTFPELSRRKVAKIYEDYYPWKKTSITKINRSDFSMPSKFLVWRKGLGINGQYLVSPKSKVLDVGCGLGHSLLEMESVGISAYGIDPDKNASKIARKFNLNFKNGFIEDNPFPKEKFDFVIANQVLEHTNDPIKFLKTIKSRLNKNGKIILSFPNINSLTRYLFKNNWLHWHIPYHFNFFTNKAIKVLAKKTGLKVLKVKTITPNMWTNLQVRRLMQNPKMGIRDTFWDGKVDKSEKYVSGIYPKLVYLSEEYNFINRIIDTLGYGESFSITLQKDE